MEMKNGCSSPRDRIDDDLLAKLLEESEIPACQYGNVHSRNRCGCRRPQINVNPAVSCEPCRREAKPVTEQNDCGCRDDDCAKKNCLSGYPLAMSYTPDQEWRELYDVEEGMHHGTIFRELDLPFYPGCRLCR